MGYKRLLLTSISSLLPVTEGNKNEKEALEGGGGDRADADEDEEDVGEVIEFCPLKYGFDTLESYLDATRFSTADSCLFLIADFDVDDFPLDKALTNSDGGAVKGESGPC